MMTREAFLALPTESISDEDVAMFIASGQDHRRVSAAAWMDTTVVDMRDPAEYVLSQDTISDEDIVRLDMIAGYRLTEAGL